MQTYVDTTRWKVKGRTSKVPPPLIFSIIGPSEVRALPVWHSRRAAWQTEWPLLTKLFLSLSLLSALSFIGLLFNLGCWFLVCALFRVKLDEKWWKKNSGTVWNGENFDWKIFRLFWGGTPSAPNFFRGLTLLGGSTFLGGQRGGGFRFLSCADTRARTPLGVRQYCSSHFQITKMSCVMSYYKTQPSQL